VVGGAGRAGAHVGCVVRRCELWAWLALRFFFCDGFLASDFDADGMGLHRCGAANGMGIFSTILQSGIVLRLAGG